MTTSQLRGHQHGSSRKKKLLACGHCRRRRSLAPGTAPGLRPSPRPLRVVPSQHICTLARAFLSARFLPPMCLQNRKASHAHNRRSKVPETTQNSGRWDEANYRAESHDHSPERTAATNRPTHRESRCACRCRGKIARSLRLRQLQMLRRGSESSRTSRRGKRQSRRCHSLPVVLVLTSSPAWPFPLR